MEKKPKIPGILGFQREENFGFNKKYFAERIVITQVMPAMC